MASVDFKTASLILDRAYTESEFVSGDIGNRISKVLRGTHKTYRYILVTAILAKATNDNIDTLSLQKGNGTDGKYDARSLCHKVIVPFESINLPGCLGGSNEPFLNKPARFTSLSAINAKVSNHQLYKQAGNAVSVNTVYAILQYLFGKYKIGSYVL